VARSRVRGVDPLTRRERQLRETVRDQKSAEAALTRLLGEVDEDRHPKSNITLKQPVDRWFDVAELAETTRERYEDLIRLYVEPALGHLLAGKLHDPEDPLHHSSCPGAGGPLAAPRH
jgi:integrase